MSNYKLFSLKDVADSQTGPFGSQLHQSDYVSEGTPMVTVEHLGVERFTHQNLPFVSDKDRDRLSKYILKEGDIVFSRVGSVDRCTYVTKEEDGWMFSGRCIRVRTNENANGRYLNFYFRQETFKKMMMDISVGATMPSLNTKLMDAIPLRLPNIQIQQKIAKVLSDLDAKIELNNKINDNLEQIAKTLYDYWFVQFDFPDANGKPYKTSGGKMVLNEDLKREIPHGWEVEKVSKSSDIVDCLHSKKSDFNFVDEETYLLQLENIKDDGLINLSKKYYVSKEDYKTWTSRIEVKDNDIIITNAGRVAATAQISSTIIAGIGRNITAIRPISISPTFLYVAFQGSEMKRQITLNTDTGTFFKSLNVKGIKELLIARPSKDIEDKFESTVLPMRRKREQNQTENQELASLRDWLLPMLMNGQVKVADVEGIVNEKLGMVAEGNVEYKKS